MVMEMNEREAVENLKKSLSSLLTFDAPEMYERAEWGSKLTFTPYKVDFERVFGLARIFSDLPYDLLPDAQLTQITAAIDGTANHFSSIDELDIQTVNNAQQTFKSLGDQVKVHADAVTVEMAQWISYLAYQKGDVAANISKLESAIEKADGIIITAVEEIAGKQGEIEKIVQTAQDFAGDKGVTIFTEQFNNAAIKNAEEASTWLKFTAGIFAVTIIAILIFLYQLQGVTAWYEWISRAAFIGVLITAGLWCGKTYRILRHQETTNLHKANGLKSFLLFRDAADNDEATRNAVLRETTKSIFSSQSSGFITEHGKKSDQEVHIIDASRTLGAAGSVAKAATKDGTA